MIRLLIADDSPTQRMLLRRILENDEEFQIVGEAVNGEEAISLCRKLVPDIITMDINMPRMNGYEAIRHIMGEMPRPIVVLTSTESDMRLGISFKAIECGALMVLRKPHGLPGEDATTNQLIAMLKAMSDVKVVRRNRWSHTAQPKTPERAKGFCSPCVHPFRLIAIGVSTGGPPALQVILSGLPADFPVPITIVQHISRDFVHGLADWLNTLTPLRVKVAESGETLNPATVYLAPDDTHLTATAHGGVRLKSMPPVDGHRPSATALFESVAGAHGAAGIGVILTGMGSDGARGLKTLHDAGGYTIAQDEKSCIIFGMPKEAIAMGAVHEVLPLDLIGERLKQLVSG